jgi:predicted HicB family RNase H-like nuclease
MSEPYLEYKGYIGSAEVDAENDVLVGKLLYIRDTITYTARTPAKLRAAFQEAVDDYLATCEEEGDEPDVPFKGSFNVRVGPARHRAAAIAARLKDIGLNEFVCFALDSATNEVRQTVVHRHQVKITLAGELQQWMGSTAAGQLVPVESNTWQATRDNPKH